MAGRERYWLTVHTGRMFIKAGRHTLDTKAVPAIPITRLATPPRNKARDTVKATIDPDLQART